MKLGEGAVAKVGKWGSSLTVVIPLVLILPLTVAVGVSTIDSYRQTSALSASLGNALRRSLDDRATRLVWRGGGWPSGKALLRHAATPPRYVTESLTKQFSVLDTFGLAVAPTLSRNPQTGQDLDIVVGTAPPPLPRLPEPEFPPPQRQRRRR